MSRGLRRGLADLICRALQASLPPALQSWGWAIRWETADIQNDTKALMFALDSLRGLMPRAFASHLQSSFAALIGAVTLSTEGLNTMTVYNYAVRRPRALGIACAIGAVMLGLAYMAMAGAPTRYLGINVGALTIGLAMLALLGQCAPATSRGWSGAIALMAGALLATALLGNPVDGAARWISVGGLSIQPSLMLLPVMLVAFARDHTAPATAGIIVAVAAMAIQPDRAMAGMLAAGLTALALMRPNRHVMTAFVASMIGFATTLSRADSLPAVPFVDQILYSSFDIHPAAGAAVITGSALLLVPAIVGWGRDPANRDIYAAFGAAWLTGIMAAALGNYPTPIVGYGGSAIIGYALSLLALPKQVQPRPAANARSSVEADTPQHDRHMLVGLA